MDMTLARQPVGQLLDGRYRVESLVARGGMATVYLGIDTRLDRTVALKIMHAELANDQDFVRRFVGEARSVALLSHPNVVGVYDQGADGRMLYLVMEYVPGKTLRDLLNERSRLSPREALDIMDGVLSGLAAAHAAGLAHRDVKPENVLLTSSLAVKVADFGLARLLSGVSHTKTGMIIGTAAYLAPEQVSRGIADARTDVYASGVMLFELLTGVQPHRADTPLAVAYKHVNEAVPPPSSVVPGLPSALDALVALSTSRNPDLRPSDAGQFLRAVTGARQGLPVVSVASGDYQAAGDLIPGMPARPTQDLNPRVPSPPAGDLIPGMSEPPADHLIPGMSAPPTAPALPLRSPQPWQDSTRQVGEAGGGPNRTLIVAAPGTLTGHGPGGYRGHREPGLQRWLFSRRLAYVLGGIALALLVALLVWWQSAGKYTHIPRVGGLLAATARTELRNDGLKLKPAQRRFDNSVPAGSVIATIPAVGSQVSHGAAITLIVSQGPHMIAVPQVTGAPLANAQASLKHAGLTAGTAKQVTSATIQSGIVISTSPAAGTSWPQTKPVGLVVSAGPPVPNFVGQQKAVAEQWAQANGVSLNEVAAAKSAQPAGTVTRQSLAAGSAFTKGQVITIKYSNGPPMVQIPNLDGMSAAKAVRTLQHLGLKPNVVRAGPFQSVFNYSPNGQAPQGSTVTIWVGLPHL
ncbi:MAG TPA: PASTA domain-containing protein [Streptosporangiaceae bacterium]|nr:PASTA domain-containing protein [Streptosporangiaceae bacterium]